MRSSAIKTVYVKEMRRDDGQYKQGKTVGVLNGNMYGSRSAGSYFTQGLMKWLRKKDYTPTEFDTCLHFKQDGDHLILFYVCIDDFLVISTTTTQIDDLYSQLREKYDIKRLGMTDKYLSW